MANSNWGEQNLPAPRRAAEQPVVRSFDFRAKPPVPTVQERTEQLTALIREIEVEQLSNCKACFEWQFGDAVLRPEQRTPDRPQPIRCEEHGYEG